MHYKPVKIIINTLELAEVILNIIIWYHSLFNLIVSNRNLLFIS